MRHQNGAIYNVFFIPFTASVFGLAAKLPQPMVQVVLSKSVSQEEQGKIPQPMVQVVLTKSVSQEEQGPSGPV